MSLESTDKSKYESRYGGGFISANQFIAEKMCENLAYSRKTNLPFKFWNLPAWKKDYMNQILAANTVLKVWQPQVILAVIREQKNIYSLRASWIHDLFKKKQLELEKLAPKETTTLDVSTTDEIPRESFKHKKSAIDKLRDL